MNLPFDIPLSNEILNEIETITTENGTQIKVIGEGTPLLFFHGGRGSWLHWVNNIEMLKAHYQLHIFDLPSFGASSTLTAADAPAATYFEQTIESIKQLFPNDERFHLAGFSFGGLTASATTVSLPEQVLTLSLLAPAGFALKMPKVSEKASLRADMTEQEILEVHRTNLNALLLSSNFEVDETTLAIQHYNISSARYYSFKPSAENLLDGYLKQITAPTQVIIPEQDIYMAPNMDEDIERCRQQLPDLRFDRLPDAGHWGQYENPTAYNQLLHSFIQQAGTN